VGLFSRKVIFGPGAEGQEVIPVQTISGQRVSTPEGPSSMQRRARLYGAAQRLAGTREGQPLTVAVDNLLARERSLQKWVALRGALTFLNIVVNEGQVVSLAELERAVPDIPKPDHLAQLLSMYGDIEKLSFQQVAGHSLLGSLTPSWALTMITWSASAMTRTRAADNFTAVPEPDALTQPGWYTEPVFAKAQRYWNGNDWEARVRSLEGNTWHAVNLAL
jgi:hypothetical protein